MVMESEHPAAEPAAPSGTPVRRRTRWPLWAAAGALTIAGAGWRLAQSGRGAGGPAPAARRVAPVVRVVRGELVQTAGFQAELRPYFAVDLHAKFPGFVSRLFVDIGSSVRKGDVLAELEIPLLAEDIERAKAAVGRSEEEVRRTAAAAEDAHLASDRLAGAAKAQPNLIAQQRLDTAHAEDLEAQAALAGGRHLAAAARAELARLQTQDAERRVTAPFDGVVTRLFANPGDSLQGGLSPSGEARPLVRLAQLDPLRLSFPVSASYVGQVHAGDLVVVQMDDGRTLTNRINRVSGDLDMGTRMMEVQADIPNPDAALTPGVYGHAILVTGRQPNALLAPVEAIRRETPPTVLVVGADEIVRRVTVRLGKESPTQVEVLEGVREGDLIVVGGGTKAGVKVEPKVIKSLSEL